jgi:uncharacterized coiled-coil protein SlyX
MKSKIRLKATIRSFTVVALALLGFALLPRAHAVVPAPDGGYPNFTTAEGTNAVQNLTTGAGNTGVGWYSLFTDTTASFNTGVGGGTLVFNNADSNTAIGVAALLFNTNGDGNTAVGVSPDLITRDKNGKPQTVRYEAVNAMLLNEFLKEHRNGEQQDRKIEEQEARIAKQQKQIHMLMAMVKEQAAQIQKVSARLEVNKGVQQMASE